MKKKESDKCKYCNGTGKHKVTDYLPVSKMQKIVKKYGLSQAALADLCHVTQTCVNHWFNPKVNKKGIKEYYFNILAKKGYK